MNKATKNQIEVDTSSIQAHVPDPEVSRVRCAFNNRAMQYKAFIVLAQSRRQTGQRSSCVLG